MKGILRPYRSGQFLQFSYDAVVAEPYRLELAENKSVRESRVIFLVSVLPEYSQALPDRYLSPQKPALNFCCNNFIPNSFCLHGKHFGHARKFCEFFTQN